MALLIGISFVMSAASADHDSNHEYDFRISDDPGNEGSVDPEASIELKVEIENYLDAEHQFEVLITNSDDLDDYGLEMWWSSDGQDQLTSQSTTIPSIDVSKNSVQAGITITIQATENAIYGSYDVNLKCRDKDNSDPEGTKQTLELTVNVNEKAAVSLNIAESGSTEGSVDIDGETTYQVNINNDGNKEDTFSLSISSNSWDASFEDDSITIAAFSNQVVTLTVESENGVEYGDSDDLTVIATSGNDGSINGNLDITTYVRVLYGIGLTATSSDVSGQPGDTVTFNFKVLNKWSDDIVYEIIKIDWYQGSIDNRPENWGFDDKSPGTLDAFTESSSARVSIDISSGADAGDVVTVIIKARVIGDNDDIGAVELEIKVTVKGEYNVQIVLPKSDQIDLDSGKTVTISEYIRVHNFADVSDLVEITASWEMGGNDWELSVPDPMTIEASGEKPIYLSVKAPESQAGNQAMLKIRVQSSGDSTKFDETTITFRVNTASSTVGPETEKLSEENDFPINPIYLVSIVLIIGLGSAAVFGLSQRSKGAFGGSDELVDDFSDEWAGMEGAAPPPAAAPPQPVAPPLNQIPAAAPPQPVAPPAAAPPQPQAPPSTAAIPETSPPPQPVAPPPVAAAPTILTVTVPDGVMAGQQLQIKAPTGQLVNVKVPEGCGPGSQFKIQI
jgi:hypothetical protein